MLSPGATIHDPGDPKVPAMFEAIIQQVGGAGDGLSSEMSADATPAAAGAGPRARTP